MSAVREVTHCGRTPGVADLPTPLSRRFRHEDGCPTPWTTGLELVAGEPVLLCGRCDSWAVVLRPDDPARAGLLAALNNVPDQPTSGRACRCSDRPCFVCRVRAEAEKVVTRAHQRRNTTPTT
jgi:hypothetical protein